MAFPSVLLIECLSGLGAHEADAALRIRALRKSGLAGRAIVIDSSSPAERTRAIASAASRAVAERPSMVCVVASESDWRAVDRALPATISRCWWPSVVAGSGSEPGTSRALTAFTVGANPPRQHLALHCAPVRSARERAPAALWDGDFVLAPGPLRGAEGERLLRAYAAAVEERPQWDLVVLTDPDPVFQGLAHSLGIGWRVHCAGDSPREAEHTWLATAAAVLLPLSQPVTAGLVVRILAGGAPLIIDGATPAARALGAWLDDASLGGASPEAGLAAVLAREPRVRDACERGRLIAAQHEPEALAARLGFTLDGEDRRPREAA